MWGGKNPVERWKTMQWSLPIVSFGQGWGSHSYSLIPTPLPLPHLQFQQLRLGKTRKMFNPKILEAKYSKHWTYAADPADLRTAVRECLSIDCQRAG